MAMAQKRILVVDDETTVLAVITRVLQADRHLVQSAGSGEEALAKLDAGEFDLAIIDLNMPGMSGEELAREIAARRPGLKLMLMTGALVQDELPGISEVLVKPFSMQELREKVN